MIMGIMSDAGQMTTDRKTYKWIYNKILYTQRNNENGYNKMEIKIHVLKCSCMQKNENIMNGISIKLIRKTNQCALSILVRYTFFDHLILCYFYVHFGMLSYTHRQVFFIRYFLVRWLWLSNCYSMVLCCRWTHFQRLENIFGNDFISCGNLLEMRWKLLREFKFRCDDETRK